MNSDITVIKPQRGWRSLDFAELWRYRELLSALAMRDIKVRYKQTVLGLAWAIIQPVTAMLIFSIIFGRLAQIPSDGMPYPIFVFSGLLAWNFFSTAVSSSGMSLLSAGGMISKVYFPRIIVPLASVGVGIADFLVAVLILFALMAYYAVPLTWQICLFPLFFLGLILTATGLGAWLAAVTVVYRDFRFIIPFMLQIWMYLTPVIYPASFIPEKWRWLLFLNPILGWVEGIRSAFLGRPIDWTALAVSLLLTLIILFIGLRYFEKAERRFADVI
ncbi:MAG: ABC transporter permease [Gammaproteobacteria bacterium]|nr:ABC transporter permease [Gammaproteobacteria bacterium]